MKTKANVTTKAWARLNLLPTLKFRVSRKSLEKMYIYFVRPLLEYCDSVWDNATTETKKKQKNSMLFTLKQQELLQVLPNCVASN